MVIGRCRVQPGCGAQPGRARSRLASWFMPADRQARRSPVLAGCPAAAAYLLHSARISARVIPRRAGAPAGPREPAAPGSANIAGGAAVVEEVLADGLDLMHRSAVVAPVVDVIHRGPYTWSEAAQFFPVHSMILRITVRLATAPPFLPTFSAARARKPVPNGLRRRDLGPDRHCATAAQPAAAPFTPPPVRRQSSPRQHRTERALTAQHELRSRQDRANSWTSVDHILTRRTPRRRLALVPAEVGLAVGDYEQMPQLRLADRVGPGEVEWPDLGYADACLDSWAVFSRLREDGVIPAGVRFQFEYPTPTAPISFMVTDQQETLLESYAAALFADLAASWRPYRTTRSRSSGMWRWSSPSWKAESPASAGSRWARSWPGWPAAPTRSRRTSRPDCTCATATRVSSTSSSQSHSHCKSECSMRSPQLRGGCSASLPSPSHRTSAGLPTSARFGS